VNRRKSLVIGSVLVVLVLISVFVVVARMGPAPPRIVDGYEVVMFDLRTGRETLVIGGLDLAGAARFMPDRSVVMHAQINGTLGIWHVAPARSPTLLWEGIVGAPSPSSDGSRIVFGEHPGGLRILDVGSGTSEAYTRELLGLPEGSGAGSPSLSRTDDKVIFNWKDGTGPQHIEELYLGTNETRILLTVPDPPTDLHGAAFLPDGQHAVYALDGLYLLDLGLNVSFRLTGPGEAGFPRVAGMGRAIVYQVRGPIDASGRPLFGISVYRLDSQETIEVFASRQQTRPFPDIDFDGQTILFAREHYALSSQASP